MAQVTFSVRMDETLKKQFDTLCADFGMTASTVQLVSRVIGGEIVPVYSNEIMREYREVLGRKKFKLSQA